MLNLVEYAKSELERLIPDKNDIEAVEMQKMINKNIIDIVKLFSDESHSGTSAYYVINILNRLLKWKPISPLTGDDSEWRECTRSSKEKIYQNIRCSSVFKTIHKDGSITVRDIDSVIMSDNGGITWFSGSKCKQYEENISFPYSPVSQPKKIYIEYTKETPPGETSDEYENITDKPDRIKALHDRKRIEFDSIVEF